MPKIKISSDFAILDVTKGRKKLDRRFRGLLEQPRIPVTIRGFIVGVHGRDDGVSQEFEIEVTSAEEHVR